MEKSKMTGLLPVVKMLKVIDWQWTKARMKQTAADLGLVDPTTGSDRWIGYPSPSPDFAAPDAEYPFDRISLLDSLFKGEKWSTFTSPSAPLICMKCASTTKPTDTTSSATEVRRIRGSLQKAVKQISTVLGKPTFQGGGHDPENHRGTPDRLEVN